MGKIETDHTGSGGGITLSSDGTSLLLDGTAIGGGGGGVTGFDSADNTASPNDTVNVASIAANSSSTNAGVAIVPKGTGALMLAIPDSGTGGGNVRGSRAIDLGTGRNNADRVASGADSIVAGYNVKASQSKAICIGYGSYANGAGSLSIGNDSNCSSATSINILGGGGGQGIGSNSVVIGEGSRTNARGFSVSRGRSATKSSFARGGFVQQLQTNEAEYWGKTTDATAATISVGGLNQSIAYSYQVGPNFLGLVADDLYFQGKHYAFASVRAMAFDDTNDLMKVWDLSAAWRIAIDGSATQVGSTTKTVIHSEGTALNSADIGTSLAYRCLVLDVTGVASTNIHWTAWVKLHSNRYT